MVEKTQAEYREAVHHALERCQFIEETLRAYLHVAIRIAEIQLAPFFAVNITKEDLGKLPLGRLVNLFCRFNGNAALKSDLRRVTPDRNHVAHQSLLFTLGELGDEAFMAQCTTEMREIEQRAKAVHYALLDERTRLLTAFSKLEAEREAMCSKGAQPPCANQPATGSQPL